MGGASVLFWDLDGTLLTTGRAGIRVWELAVQDVAGTLPDLSTFATAGLTDLEIGRRLPERIGAVPTPGAIMRLVRTYEGVLPACLPLRRGRVLPGVRELLDALRDYPGVITLLPTGNTRAGAAAKLAHYGLAAYFADGGYAEAEEDRVALARGALAVARWTACRTPTSSCS
jgi:phosphoglycolate phosphatase-like HAD superfamily hydrolase